MKNETAGTKPFGVSIAPMVCLLSFFFAGPVLASNQTWNPGGAGGGAGSWNANNWDSAAAWTPGNTALFGGSAGTVTLNATSTQTIGGLIFSVSGYTLANGTLAFGGAPTIIATSGGTTTFSSTLALTGAAGTQITKTGAGTLALNTSNAGLGTAASSSVWTITGGTLSNGVYDSVVSTTGGNNLGALPSGGGAVQAILDQGTLSLGGASSAGRWYQVNAAGGTLLVTGAYAVDGKIINNADSSHTFYAGVSPAFSASFTGVISGNGSLTKIDSGTLTLSGNNTYSGGTTITAGTLKLASATALGGTAGALAINGGTLDLNGNSVTLGNLGGSGGMITTGTAAGTSTLTVNTTSPGTYSGTINNNGSGLVALTKSGAGTLTLSGSGANTYTGLTTVTGGTLALNKAGVNAIGGNVSLGDGTGGDILQLLADNQIADTGVITLVGTTVSNRGDFRLNGFSETVGGLSGDGVVQNFGNTNSTLSLDVAGLSTLSSNSTIRDTGGATTGTLSLVKTGNGIQTLTGTNAYTGVTTVSAGALNIQSSSALGSTAHGTAVSSGAALQIQGGIAVGAEALTLGGNGTSNDGALRNISGNNTYGGLVTLTAATRINSDAGALTLGNTGAIGGSGFGLTVGGAGDTSIAGTIGSGAVTKDGAGMLTLTGNNTYSGNTTISAGTLKFTNVNALGNGTVSLANSSTMLSGVAGTVANRLSLGAGSATIDSGAFTTTLSGVISGSGSLIKTGTGTLIIGHNSTPNTFTGGVTLNSGTLGISQGDSLGALPGAPTTQFTFAGNSTLQFRVANPTALNANRLFAINPGVTATFDTNGYNVTIGGAIAGSSGVLTKIGGGTLTLNGTNTYGGGTMVNEGTLRLGNAGAIGSGTAALSVNGGTLDMNGFSKSVGALTSQGGSFVGFNVGGSGLSATSATISGNISIGFNGASISAPGTYNLITSSGGGLTGTFRFVGAPDLSSLIVKGSNNFYQVSLNNTDVAEQIVVTGNVPAKIVGIMPLGASITAGYSTQAGYGGGGYRTQLYQNLVNDGRLTPNFVGSGTSYPENLLTTVGQGSHEGHFGYTTSHILDNLNANDGYAGNNGGYWLSANNTATTGTNSPAYIPLNVGGNDFSGNNTLAQNEAVKNRYDAIVSKVSELRPGATVIVTNQMYRANAAGPLINTYFNPFVQGIVFNHVLAGQNVQFLDLYSLITPGNSTTSLPDGIHPNQAGYDAIGNAIYDSIAYGSAYWTGNEDGNWGTVTGGNATNWAMDTARTTDRQAALNASTDVYFNNSASPLAVALTQDGAVRSLNFTGGAAAAVSINGNNTLSVGSGGITVQQGTGAHNVAANVALASDQTWGNVSSNDLTINGVVSGSGNLTIVGSYTLYSGDNSTTISAQTVSGTGAIVLAGNNTYTGTTTVTSGTLILNGTNSSSGVVLGSGGTLEGSGKIAGAISGAGLVAPGNSPGIFTAALVDPTGGLDFAFEFTATGAPAFGNAAASVNDVLHLNHASTPFLADLTGANDVNIYLNLATIAAGDLFQGGFFTDKSEAFVSSIDSAAFACYVKGDGGGSHTYNGFNYYTLAEYNPTYSINLSTVQVPSAAFADGTISNGYISQLNVVPEPSTLALLAGGLTVIMAFRRRD